MPFTVSMREARLYRGALTFGNNGFSTTRNALGERLQANFSGQNYGLRWEGVYRYAIRPTT